MGTEMKLAFVWWFDKAKQVFDNWRDGLRAAIETLETDHEVDWFIGQDQLPEDKYDAILFWDDSNSSFFQHLPKYKAKKGLFLTTNPHNISNLKLLDVVYCESTIVQEEVRQHGIRTVKAFGTDDEFFKPHNAQRRDVEYFYPATFSPWKKQSALAHLGSQLLCIGTLQPDGQEELEAVKNAGCKVMIGYFPAEVIRDYYRRTKHMIIPAVHGSERTILESMSMGIKPVIMFPEVNSKAYTYIKELEESGLEPRDFILKHYSSRKYAEDILRGICD